MRRKIAQVQVPDVWRVDLEPLYADYVPLSVFDAALAQPAAAEVCSWSYDYYPRPPERPPASRFKYAAIYHPTWEKLLAHARKLRESGYEFDEPEKEDTLAGLLRLQSTIDVLRTAILPFLLLLLGISALWGAWVTMLLKRRELGLLVGAGLPAQEIARQEALYSLVLTFLGLVLGLGASVVGVPLVGFSLVRGASVEWLPWSEDVLGLDPVRMLLLSVVAMLTVVIAVVAGCMIFARRAPAVLIRGE